MTVETLFPIHLYKIENTGTNNNNKKNRNIIKMFYMLSLVSESETNILYQYTENQNIVEKVQRTVVVSHPNQLINSRHRQSFPEPLNGLSVWVSRLHNHGEDQSPESQFSLLIENQGPRV